MPDLIRIVVPGRPGQSDRFERDTTSKAQVLVEGVPLRRTGDGEDLKEDALLLASDAGKHVGQILAVDGGITAV
jgi:NAD(P)-dependent dehydrogenase (short-subunit alcohol dehydrogenase family)